MSVMNDLMRPEILWAIAGLILLIAEFAAPGLILFFFGVGALLVALVCAVADISLNAQLILFAVTSVASLLVLRKWLKQVFFGNLKSSNANQSNLDSVVGHTAEVVEAISPDRPGRVELNGTNWKAEADESIEAGVRVLIEAQNSLVLKVVKKS